MEEGRKEGNGIKNFLFWKSVLSAWGRNPVLKIHTGFCWKVYTYVFAYDWTSLKTQLIMTIEVKLDWKGMN